MYYTLGISSCIRNICLTIKDEDQTKVDLDILKQAYRKFCTGISGNLVCPPVERHRWITEHAAIEHIIRHYKIDSSITDIQSEFLHTTNEARMAVCLIIDNALKEIKLIDDALSSIFDLYIHTMFYERSDHSGGGSVSSAPGVIWCSPRKNWSQRDVVEFLLHELTHNLLFVDERMNGFFPDMDALANPENYALSTVLKKNRPLDKVFHSLVVGNEIVQFRKIHGEQEVNRVHPTTSEIIQSINNTLKSLEFAIDKGLLSERVKEIIDLVKDQQGGSSRRAA